MPGDYVTIEVNGREADQAAVSLLEQEGWGHFTAMQVRGGRARGLGLHLSRLEAAHHDVYGRALGGQEVRARIRHALGGRADASVRVYGYWAGLIVTVREPQDTPRRPHSMTAMQFQRPLARLKHVGSWGQGRFREAALAARFDEGLLVDETGRISEGTITNVGFWRDGMVIWPEAPKLAGITMLLLRRQLTAAGIGQAEEQVRVQDLGSYDGMILCNSRGWAPVGRVDDLVVPQDGYRGGMAETQREPVPRVDSGELDTALAFLSFARHCVLKKAGGLSDEQLRRVLTGSGTSVLGLVQHLAEAERYWFGHHLAGDAWDAGREHGMAVPASRAAAGVLRDYQTAIQDSDRAIRAAGDPEARFAVPVDGNRHTLRWVMAHMTSETARHAGHADILREQLDGTTGR